MNSNIVGIVENISQSAFSVQHLVTGFAYILGICFFIAAIKKFKAVGGQGGEGMFVAVAYLFGGTTLLFLPTIYVMASNTVFGVGNILQYTTYSPYNIYSAMVWIIRTAGIIWFVRGSVLLTQASHPGSQHGPKGLFFLFAGILSMNFETTISWINWLMSLLAAYTLGSSPTGVE